VAKLLLGREDIHPNIPDKCGRTPLWWVAECGYWEVLKPLLGREGVIPYVADNRG